MDTPSRGLLRINDPALALYFRPGRNDHTSILQMLAAGPPSFSGAVLDASLEKRHRELRLQLENHRHECVLDPMALELATPGGWERDALRQLEWAGKERHVHDRFAGSGVAALVDPIAKFATEKRYSAVLAPTHFIQSIDDPWWKIDRRAARRLRHQLDSSGRPDIPIYYRLAVPRQTLIDREQRFGFVAGLAEIEIDAVWLCLHPASSRSGPAVVRSYLDLCRDLAAMGIPLVAERTGFLGLVLMGMNAVGGIESGITLGQGFDANRLLSPPTRDDSGSVFGPQPRVYLERLGVTLTRAEAQALLGARGMKRRFACQDRPCCRSWEDMIRDPRRHFLFTRAQEVASLSRIPIHDRPILCLDWVRNASDEAVHAAKFDSEKFEKDRKRLSEWRLTLTSMVDRREFSEAVFTPHGQRLQQRPQASSLH
jgi:hypothetical protein